MDESISDSEKLLIQQSKKTPHLAIDCFNVPDDLFDRVTAKEYFQQFGRVTRMFLRPNRKSCTVEYHSQAAAEDAYNGLGEFKGELFEVFWKEDSPQSKKSPPAKKKAQEIDPEVKAELDAMGVETHQSLLRPEVIDLDPPTVVDDKLSKQAVKVRAKKAVAKALQRRRISSESGAKKREKAKTKRKSLPAPSVKTLQVDPVQVAELVAIINASAHNAEEQFQVLEARDKLIRIHTLRERDLTKATKTIGTCPDMCPEKERLMREAKHQVAMYEQEIDENGELRMNHKIAIKQYSRSSADQEVPLPHELRPVPVLQLTIGYLLHRIVNMCEEPDVNIAEWYHFMWDRTRGIRKDITQQELCCLGSVELVEQCARFHIHCAARLVAEDPSVCDQKINTENLTKCLQTLKYMYHDLNIKNISCPNEAEFRGYIILLNLGDGNFMWEVQQLKLEIQRSPEIKFGIRVFSALDNNNYVSFFKLVRSTTYLNACILLRYFNKVRYRAINTIVKTYSGRAILTRMPIIELQNILAFEDIQATISFLESYGLKFDETQIQVVLDRKSFVNTNTTYELERAVNIIESKRKCSVSEIICGKALPPKNYETHKLQCSFENGFLKASEMDPKWSVKTIRNPPKLVLPAKFTSSSHSNVSENKQSTTIAPSSVFAVHNSQSSSSIFNSPPLQPNILAVTDSAIIKASPFGNKGSQPSSIFGVQKSESFFGPSTSQPFPSVFKPLEKNIFGEKSETKFDGMAGRNIFGQPKSNQPADSNIFRERKTETTSGIFGTFTTTVKPSIGDGRSELMKAAQNKMIEEMKIKKQAELEALLEEEKKRKLEEARIKAEEEARRKAELEQRRIMEEAKKRAEEEARKKAEEEARKKAEEEVKRKAELEAKRRAEEARRKLEEDKRKAEEARRRAEEEARRRAILEAEMKRRALEEKRLKEMLEKKERETAVFQLVESLLTKVEDVDREYRLNAIKSKIKNRKLINMIKLWRHKVIVAKKKRKAVDDLPIWLPSLSMEEEANELYTSSQNETLQNMKRYKLGKSQTFKLLQKSQRLKINVQKVAYTVLKKRMQDNANCVVNNLFWKVVISIPDQKESQRDVVDRLENVVDNMFDHVKPNFDGNVIVCEKIKPNSSDTLAVCIQKNRGLDMPLELKFEKFDLMVLGINSEEFIDRINYRLCTFLRTKPKLSKIPIVLILRRGQKPVSETLIERTLKLDGLIENNLISDYCILFDDVLTKDNLISLIEKGLKWLASETNEAPPLEMDFLQNVLLSSLTEEFTSRLNSSASSNPIFQKALNNPRVIVEVYNESINRLIDLLFDKRNLNYPSFPKNLKSFIDIEKSYPQKYERFPDFWRNDVYRTKIKNEISQLLLPVVRWDWPSKSLSQLKEQIRKYCTAALISNSTEKVFLKILSVILSHFENDDDFVEKINKFSWLDVFEIIMTEKINYINFNLKEFQIVVYNQDDMKSFKTYPWWYESRYVTDYLKSIKLPANDIEQNNTKRQKIAVDDFELDFDIDKALEDITMSYNENTARVKKDDRSKFYSLFNDLKLTIDIHKQAVKKTDEILTAQIEKGKDIKR